MNFIFFKYLYLYKWPNSMVKYKTFDFLENVTGFGKLHVSVFMRITTPGIRIP